MLILKILRFTIVKVNQILFGTETYVNTVNTNVKFYVKIPTNL